MKVLIPIAASLPLAVLPALDGASAPTVPTAASVFAGRLDQLPASFLDANESVMLSYVDMSLVWERLGVGTDLQERLDAFGRTAEVDTFAQPLEFFGSSAFDVDGARSEIGFSAFEIEREAALVAPPYQVIVAETSVSATAVADAIASDPVWSSDLNDVDSAAGAYWTWGADPMANDLARRTPMRELGQGGAVAVAGDTTATVIRTLTPDDAEAAMRTVAGAEPSVADEGPFAPAVAAVGDAEVVQALGSTAMAAYMPITPGADADADDIAEAVASAVTFAPYLSVTVIESVADGGYTTEIVLVHADAATAEDNAETAVTWLTEGVDAMTQAPIAELLPDATVVVEGSVLRVSLPTGTYARAVRMLTSGSLFPV